MEKRKMHDNDCATVYTLNTWTDEKKAEVRKLLEQGKWVRFGCTAIGHTRSAMTERDGLNWVMEEYVGIIRIAEREGYGDVYVQLI